MKTSEPKPSSDCTIWQCWISSNSTDFRITVMFLLFSLLVSWCSIKYTRQCGISSNADYMFFTITTIHLIGFILGRCMTQHEHTKCISYSNACSSTWWIKLVVLILTFRTLSSVSLSTCPNHMFIFKIYLIVAVGIRAIQYLLLY